jgi:hypothetical protein
MCPWAASGEAWAEGVNHCQKEPDQEGAVSSLVSADLVPPVGEDCSATNDLGSFGNVDAHTFIYSPAGAIASKMVKSVSCSVVSLLKFWSVKITEKLVYEPSWTGCHSGKVGCTVI